jgi:uncharacterized protein
MSNEHNKINYLEIPVRDMEATKTFFNQVFGWTFEDYGPDYCSFSDQGTDGGFYKSDLTTTTQNGSVLVIFYSNALEQTLADVEQAGGTIIRSIFSFPGGRRFHFSDPNGNEFAVWSE